MFKLKIIWFISVLCCGYCFGQINYQNKYTINHCYYSFKNAYKFAAKDSIKNYDTPASGWVTFGLGNSFAGPSGEASLTVRYKNNLFTFRYLKADEFRFNPGGADYDDPLLSFSEIGLLYGRQFRKEFVLLSFSGGIGIVDGTNRGKNIEYNDYERISLSTVGVPFEAKFRIEIGFIGIGGAWFGNINTKKVISGGIMEISIGKFK